ncbi:hypothetical protein TGP89_209670 [Toxoplasma gondii p89]|uniref:Uncharacterized protein n=1 Tax=Toxoplasma gondii p89 TaxID=943119 RepID=A0A086JAM6_TOXGO|nr:hypothetical protein TGP89_209670 [Toxoplasma gondii p89]
MQGADTPWSQAFEEFHSTRKRASRTPEVSRHRNASRISLVNFDDGERATLCHLAFPLQPYTEHVTRFATSAKVRPDSSVRSEGATVLSPRLSRRDFRWFAGVSPRTGQLQAICQRASVCVLCRASSTAKRKCQWRRRQTKSACACSFLGKRNRRHSVVRGIEDEATTRDPPAPSESLAYFSPTRSFRLGGYEVPLHGGRTAGAASYVSPSLEYRLSTAVPRRGFFCLLAVLRSAFVAH